MGYDIHITRAENWSDKEPSITVQEWLAVLDVDPEMQVIDRDRVDYEGCPAPVCYLIEKDRWGETLATKPLCYSQGEVWVKKPNVATLLKMLELAHKLGARVMGGDGEIYSALDTPEKPTQFKMDRPSWWRPDQQPQFIPPDY